MKKTLTKAASLVLVFAMLLSVFAVFAGSSKAAPGDKVRETLVKVVEAGSQVRQNMEHLGQKVVDLIKDDIGARKAALGQPGYQVGEFVKDVIAIPVKIEDTIRAKAGGIHRYLGVSYQGAYNALAKLVYTYTDPEGTAHAFYRVGTHVDGDLCGWVIPGPVGNFELVNAAFGIKAVYDYALWDLRTVGSDTLRDARLAVYTEQLTKLVALRDSKMNLLLDVYAAGGDIVAAINKAIDAVADVYVKAPMNVVSAELNAGALFGKVVRDIVLRPFPGTFLRFVDTTFQAVRTAVAGKAAVNTVKTAVSSFMTFAQTIGGISDAVAETTGTVQALFNWITEHISAALPVA